MVTQVFAKIFLPTRESMFFIMGASFGFCLAASKSSRSCSPKISPYSPAPVAVLAANMASVAARSSLVGVTMAAFARAAAAADFFDVAAFLDTDAAAAAVVVLDRAPGTVVARIESIFETLFGPKKGDRGLHKF